MKDEVTAEEGHSVGFSVLMTTWMCAYGPKLRDRLEGGVLVVTWSNEKSRWTYVVDREARRLTKEE